MIVIFKVLLLIFGVWCSYTLSDYFFKKLKEEGTLNSETITFASFCTICAIWIAAISSLIPE